MPVEPAEGGPVVGGERMEEGDLVGQTMKMLRAHDALSTGAKRKIGKFLFENFFGADEQAVRDSNPKKAASYAELLKRVQDKTTSWNKAKLRSVVIAEVAARSVGEGIAARLNASELAALYAVDDLAERRKLARRIAEGRLEGRAALAAIARAAAVEQKRGGARPKPAVDKAIDEMDAAVKHAVAELTVRKVRKLGRAGWERAKASVEEAIAKLQEILKNFR